jgi:hypothetical protein
MPTAIRLGGYKRPWLRFLNCTPSNKALQLTSGGFMARFARLHQCAARS